MPRQDSFTSSNSPATTVIKYVELGTDSFQYQVFKPLPASLILMSLPFETVTHEAGTVRIVSVVSRSFG